MSIPKPLPIPGQHLELKVKPGAKQNTVTWDGDTIVVHTTAPAVDGKANAAVLKLIKKKLGIRGEIVSGVKSKIKLFQVM